MSDKKSKKAGLSQTAEYLLKIKPGRTITDKELMENNHESSMWVAVHGRVFDLTEFYMEHPGGFDIIEEVAGTDGTAKYEEGDHRMESIRDLAKYYIGEYEGKKLSLQEKKQMQAKEQLQKMKKDKSKEQNRRYLGFIVATMLIMMISFFVVRIIRDSQKNNEQVQNQKKIDI